MMARTCCVPPPDASISKIVSGAECFTSANGRPTLCRQALEICRALPAPTEFSQLQNLGQHQRDLIDQPQDVIRCHFGLRFLVTNDEMDNAIWRGDEEAIEILA